MNVEQGAEKEQGAKKEQGVKKEQGAKKVRTMRRCLSTSLLAVACLAGLAPAMGAADPSPDEIIRKFAAKEKEFKMAREAYTYRQSVKLEELDADGNASGKWEIVSDIVFGPDNKRTEKVVRAPMITLHNLTLTPQDEQDLRNVQPFVLTSDDIGKYDVRYIGKQNADEIPCYVFAVKPKTMVKGERYFEGQIWVDDRDFQIVKTYGKGVGLLKRGEDNQFPKFETYREQIDGKYWFPTYTHANDTLVFQTSSQKIRMTVKYQDYKRFGAETNITFGDEVTDNKDKKPDSKPETKKKP